MRTQKHVVIALTIGCCCALAACTEKDDPPVQLQIDSVDLTITSSDQADDAALTINTTLSAGDGIGFALVAVQRVSVFESPTPNDARPLVELNGDFEPGFDRSFEAGQGRDATIVGIGNANADLMPLCGSSYLVHVCVDAVASHSAHTLTCDWRDDVPLDCP